MPSGPSAPSLAESWTVSPNGLVYDFMLRGQRALPQRGARDRGGREVLLRALPRRNATLLKEHVQEVRVLDPRRVQFHLKEPWADFITFYGTTATSAGWVVPKKYVEQVGDEGFKKAPDRRRARTGWSSFTPGVELQLEAFEGYWRKVPPVKRLVFRSLPDETTRAAALKRGDVDVAYFLNGPIAEEVRRTPGLNSSRSAATPSSSSTSAASGMRRSPWHDQRVRTGGEPRHRPARAQRRRAARLRRAHRQHGAARARVRARRSTPTPTTRRGPSGCSRRPASRAASTRATSPSPRPTRAPARPSPTTWPRSASG